MTVIAACISDDQVAMGGDSGAFTDDSSLKMTSTRPKVFRIGNWLVGSAGSFRVINLLEKSTTGSPEGVRDFLARELSNGPGGWSVLCASGAGIFEIGDDFSIIEYREPYAAIGAACELVTGSLAALSSHTDIRAQEAVRYSLSVAQTHSTMVSAPYKILYYAV
jgi:ATP-dependent protease HslVU (ClpYQ) peptidase subunit